MFVKLVITVLPLGFVAWLMFTFVGARWGVAFVVGAAVLLCLFWSAKRRASRARPAFRHAHEPALPAAVTSHGIAPLPREPTVAGGLRAAAIADLPVYVYEKKKGGGRGDECSVCLGEVQLGEVVKRLPLCMHLFHEGCIDMWLSSHATCPVCRSRVDADVPPEVALQIQS